MYPLLSTSLHATSQLKTQSLFFNGNGYSEGLLADYIGPGQPADFVLSE